MSRGVRRLAGCGLVLALLGLVAACGGEGRKEVRIQADQFRLSGTQRDAQFTVGSESFTEQRVLGSLTVQALEAAGATVTDRTGLGGNEAVREALVSERIDLYWEYTATGWLVHLSQTRAIEDPQEQYRAVAERDLEENGVRWLEPAPGNDSYAIAASAGTRQDLDARTVSDFADLVRSRPEEATLCLNDDDGFRSRFDGLPGLQRAYDFQLAERNIAEVPLEAVYGAVAEGELCNFGVVFTTSGFLREERLEPLEDDRDFFSVYNPSLTLRRETLEQYPQIERIFAPISRRLDTRTLRDLNYRVEVEGREPEAVTRGWLRRNGFVE